MVTPSAHRAGAAPGLRGSDLDMTGLFREGEEAGAGFRLRLL